MAKHFTGTCHCGSIKYQTDNKPRLVVNCHCDSCKQRNGGAFSTYASIADEHFHITEGQDKLKRYVIPETGEKLFCSDCGSPILNINYAYPGFLMLFYGTINERTDLKPLFNVYCENKAAWVDQIDQLRSFEQGIEK